VLVSGAYSRSKELNSFNVVIVLDEFSTELWCQLACCSVGQAHNSMAKNNFVYDTGVAMGRKLNIYVVFVVDWVGIRRRIRSDVAVMKSRFLMEFYFKVYSVVEFLVLSSNE
jgi:hypothetical protein